MRLLHLLCDVLCEEVPVLITLFVQGVWAWNLDSLQRWVSLPDVQPWLGVLGLGWSNAIVVKSFQNTKMPVVQCKAFNGLSEDRMMQNLAVWGCILFPLCLIEGLMPLELDLGWGKGVDWSAQQQQQQPSPIQRSTYLLSFFLLALAVESIGLITTQRVLFPLFLTDKRNYYCLCSTTLAATAKRLISCELHRMHVLLRLSPFPEILAR